MLRFFSEFTSHLERFINGTENHTLLLSLDDYAVPYAASCVRDLEHGKLPNNIRMVLADFAGLNQYRLTLTAYCEQLFLAAGSARPPVPSVTDPVAALRELLASVRALHQDPLDRTAWALLPGRIADPTAWACLIAALLPEAGGLPWCHGLRFLWREPLSTEPVLYQRPGVVLYSPDFSPSALEKGLLAEVRDENQPLAGRMQGLLFLAGIDFANVRYADAEQKYRLLHRYFDKTQDHELAALSLMELGRIHEQTQRPELARSLYESALGPALAAKKPQHLLILALNLGNLHYAEGRLADAERYYCGAASLASLSFMPAASLFAMLRQAECAVLDGRADSALPVLREAATIGGTLEDKSMLRDGLSKLLTILPESPNAVGERARCRAQILALSAFPLTALPSTPR